MRDLLITGTDTGVGKTVIAAAVIKVLRSRGVRAVGFKPVETGIEAGHEPDSEILVRASGERTPLASPLLQLEEALAPAVAAERAGVALNVAEIEARIRSLRHEGYAVVVEGAGGVLAPLSWTGTFYTVIDLAKACDLDAIIVGRAGLGTLNHVGMTVAMLRARDIPIRGVVLNRRAAAPDVAESTNPAALARMLQGIRQVVVNDVPIGDPIDAAAAVVDRLL